MHLCRVSGAIPALLITLVVAGCGEADKGTSKGWIAKEDSVVAKVATDVARDVGTVRVVQSSGGNGRVYVFEEMHTSRIGRLQTAIMLLRLFRDRGVTFIGLEGAIQAEAPLDASWFHRAMLERDRSEAEDVAVRMLGEGEISPPEFMALIQPMIMVFGTEIETEYRVISRDDMGHPGLRYLFAIGTEKLTDAEASRFVDRELRDKGIDPESEEGIQKIAEFVLTFDPWVRQQYEAIQRHDDYTIEDEIQRLRLIKGEAKKLSIAVEPEVAQTMDDYLNFLETAHKRSESIANRALEYLDGPGRDTLALLVGAGHTNRVTEVLRDRGVSFAVLRPDGFDVAAGQLSVDAFKRKLDGKWAREAVGTLGRILNGARNAPPFIEKATCKSYASMNIAALRLARAVKAGRRIPADIWDDLQDLPELRVDGTSFEILGRDVVFRAWLRRIDDSEVEVWARVGCLSTEPEAKSLEDKLFQALSDLGGGGRTPPNDPPPGTSKAPNEGPGDGSRGEFIVARISARALAVYTSNKAQAISIGQISQE